MAQVTTEPAPEIAGRLRELVEILEFGHIDSDRVHARRAYGSTANAYARIWEMPAIWREVLGIPPQYIVEVIEQHFDAQSYEEQTKTLIHELLHIPKTFSGALRGHRGQGEPINGHTVNRYFRIYQRKKLEADQADNGQLSISFE